MEENAAWYESIPEGCKPWEPMASGVLSSGACLCQMSERTKAEPGFEVLVQALYVLVSSKRLILWNSLK